MISYYFIMKYYYFISKYVKDVNHSQVSNKANDKINSISNNKRTPKNKTKQNIGNLFRLYMYIFILIIKVIFIIIICINNMYEI